MIIDAYQKLNHLEAAASPLVGVSAWQALVENIRLSKDQKILIHCGAAGIGSIAIQLAKQLGAYLAISPVSLSCCCCNSRRRLNTDRTPFFLSVELAVKRYYVITHVPHIYSPFSMGIMLSPTVYLDFLILSSETASIFSITFMQKYLENLSIFV